MPRILIAEDDPKSCEILRTTLADFGHEVVATNDGEEALAKTQHEAFDLVITDWKMPRIDGLELCQTLKRQQTNSPIIMLSTVKDPSEIQRAYDAGIEDFIQKPFNRTDLNNRIDAALKK